MSYYYMDKYGKFIDASSPIHNEVEQGLVRINELEYGVTRLIMMGYSRKEIEEAVDTVYRILKPAPAESETK